MENPLYVQISISFHKTPTDLFKAFVGANSYVGPSLLLLSLMLNNSQWLPLLTTKEDVHITFRQMRDAGVKVLRTWVRTAAFTNDTYSNDPYFNRDSTPLMQRSFLPLSSLD